MRAALTLLLLALAACGTASRAALVQPELREARTPEQFRALRGADPLVPLTWIASASRAPDALEALAIVERGLAYLPGTPDLVWMRLSLLAQLEQRQAELAGATAALGVGAPAPLVAELLGFRIDAHLAQDDPASAAADVLLLGSIADVDPARVSAAWASVALAWQMAGNGEEGDDALDYSLASGPYGLVKLRQATGLDPARMEAGAELVERARQRHPDQPDLQLYLAVQWLLQGDPAAAARALTELPEPLPPRLAADREALLARIDLLQGRVDEALARVNALLDANPGETGALAVLLEYWRDRRRPEPVELRWRLREALGAVRDPALHQVLSATLAELERQAETGSGEPTEVEAAPVP